MVSTETNTGKSANIWHQEIKKRGGGPSGKRIGGSRAPKTLLIWLTCMLHHGKKINLVTLCILFSFPNKADIEIKTFLEIICTGASEHRTWGEIFIEVTDKVASVCSGVSVWCWESQHCSCIPGFGSPSAAKPCTDHIGLNFQTQMQLLLRHQRKWWGFLRALVLPAAWTYGKPAWKPRSGKDWAFFATLVLNAFRSYRPHL